MKLKYPSVKVNTICINFFTREQLDNLNGSKRGVLYSIFKILAMVQYTIHSLTKLLPNLILCPATEFPYPLLHSGR